MTFLCYNFSKESMREFSGKVYFFGKSRRFKLFVRRITYERKKLLSMLLSAALAVTTLASCGEGTNYSNEAVKAANEAQSTVVFETDSDLAKSLQDALEDYTQTSDIKTAMVADENLKDLLTSGYQLDVYAAQGEDAEAAAQAIAQQYIVNIVSGKQSEGKIAMILHKGNGYYYAAVLTYRTGGGSGSGGSGGSSSGDDGEDNKPVSYSITVEIEGNGTATAPSTVKAGESCTITTTPAAHHKVTDVTAVDKNGKNVTISSSNNQYTIDKVNSDITVTVKFEKCAVTGIAVKENPDRMIYEDGDAFEPDGMVITVTYEDGSTEDITTGYEYETDALTPDNNEVTITYEDQETTLKVTVNKKQYVVSVTKKGEGGDVTPLGDAFVTAGEDFEFSVTLNDKVKYKVDSITIERREGYTETLALSNDNKYTVTKVESDVNVVVTFAERKLMRLDVTGIHDTYTVGDKIDLENVTVTAVYEGNVRADLSSNDYTITPITFNKDGTVEVKVKYEDVEWTKEVTVKPNTYTVTVNLDGKGKAPETFEVTAGGSHAFDVAPENGWEVTSVTVNNKNATVEFKGNKVTVSNVQGDVTVTVKLTQMEYNVTLKVVGNGTVELNGETYSNGDIIPVKHGEPLEVKATAAENYEFVSIYDGEVTHKKDSVELYITGDVTVTVKFDKIKPVVTNVEIDLKDSKNKNFKTEYWCYENLDLGDLFMEVTYNNESGKPAEYVEVTKEMIQKATVTQDLIEASSHMFNRGNENKDGYWNVTFTFTYAGKSVSFTVRVDCSEYNGGAFCLWMTDDDCSYCKNWKGLDQTASQTAIAKQHNDQ